MTHDNDEYENQRRNNSSGVFVSLLVGSLAGAVTALLLAPQSGKETREMIQEKGMELRDQINEKVEDAMAQVRTSKDRIAMGSRKKAEELVEQGQSIVADQLDRVSEAAQAGKKAIQNRD